MQVDDVDCYGASDIIVTAGDDNTEVDKVTKERHRVFKQLLLLITKPKQTL